MWPPRQLVGGYSFQNPPGHRSLLLELAEHRVEHPACLRRLAGATGRSLTVGIPVMMADPRHGVRHHSLFVAPLGSKVEEVVRREQNVESPRIGRVGVKYLSLRVLVKNTEARTFLRRKIHRPEVVRALPCLELVLRERHPIVVVEIASIRRHPWEAPSHALFEGLDFRQSCPRNRGERRIPLRQVDPHSVEIVGDERAARAAFLPSRTEHEMIDNQLAAAVEQLSQRLLSMRTLKNILFLDLLPRHLAPAAAQLIAQPGEL